MKAHHASDALFPHFDPAHLGTHCEEIGADEKVVKACKLGFWFTEEDKVINGETGQKYDYLVDIDVDDIADPLMVEWSDIHDTLTDDIRAELDKHDVVFVRDSEFHCVSYLVRPWALDRVKILKILVRPWALDRVKILEVTGCPAAGGAIKHFTAEELYAIALDEYKKAGRHVGQDEKIGLTQWAYWSAERDDFHSEDEARAEIHTHLSEECE